MNWFRVNYLVLEKILKALTQHLHPSLTNLK